MTDERKSDERKDPPSEGVRIIGAEEAAEALERGDVAQEALRRVGEPPGQAHQHGHGEPEEQCACT